MAGDVATPAAPADGLAWLAEIEGEGEEAAVDEPAGPGATAVRAGGALLSQPDARSAKAIIRRVAQASKILRFFKASPFYAVRRKL